MHCEGQYGLFLSTGSDGCLLGAILREESGVGQAIDGQGAMIQFNDDPTIKMPNGTVVPMMTRDEFLSVMAQPVDTGSLARMSHSIKHWHRVMRHINWHDVAKLQQEVVGMNISGSEKKTNCNICCTEKAKRVSISTTWGTRAKTKLAIVHTDVLGPIQQESHEGFRYAVGFNDSYSRFGAVYLMTSKDEVTAKLQRFIIDVGRRGTLLSDGALEFKSKQFNDFCTSNGIKQEFSAPYTPEENGKIERAWGTVTGMTRCMMATAGVPKQFWPFALFTAIYLKNRSIHSAQSKTPFEMFYGSKPDLSHLHVFGCQPFVLKDVRKKLDSKAREAILLEYSGILRHMWWPQKTGQRQGHQRSGYHETSTLTTMPFLTVVLQSPKRRARTMMHLNRKLMI